MITLSQVVPWGRSFDEYRKMFALGEADLAGRILGAADGPASFNAELTGQGGRVISIDPLFHFSAAEIEARVRAIYDEMVAKARAGSEHFVWDFIQSPEHLGHLRLAAMQKFLADYESGRRAGRYVCGSLPDLPFADRSFDLALCSHYLFVYSDQLDLSAHMAAIDELCRVADEVRVFPLLKMFDGGRSPHIEGVLAHSRRRGWQAELQRVPYEFQRGGNEMLVISRTSPKTRYA